MSDQNGGKTETSEADSKPDAPSDAKPTIDFSQNRIPPVIEGEAEDVTPALAAESPAAQESPTADESPPVPDAEPDLTAKAESPAGPGPEEKTAAAAGKGDQRGGAFRPVAVLLGAIALGGGGYYLWNNYVAEPPPLPAQIESAPAQTTPPQVMAPAPAPKTTESEKSPPAPAPVAEAPKKIEPAQSADNKPIAAPAPEPAKVVANSANNAQTDKAFADMATRLAAAQSAVDRLSQRLQSVESQMAAAKSDARASLAARDAGPNNSGEAAARVVVAQSLLTALSRGDDYSTELAAIQNFGGDSERLGRLRAGLSAPSLMRLAADFSALAPQLAAAAAPPKPAAETKPPRNTGEAILAYLKTGARKLIRIRPADAPEKDAAEVQIEKVEKDLRAGDLAAALADRAKLPAPALPLSAAWAAAAESRLDAETAAKAELHDALQNLTKTKS